MKEEEEFLIFMQTVHLKTLLNGFLYLADSCSAGVARLTCV